MQFEDFRKKIKTNQKNLLKPIKTYIWGRWHGPKAFKYIIIHVSCRGLPVVTPWAVGLDQSYAFEPI